MMLANKIQTLRKARGWSQSKLAEVADVSYHTIFRAEAGTEPTSKNLQKIAGALDISFSELIGEGEIERTKQDLVLRIIALLPSLNEAQLRHTLTSLEAIPALTPKPAARTR